ncbi:MAG: hypothetical protein KatS3mg125_2119 [Lysobacterales bacterium]|nr:MAG: hypothetical protein KatS3mg125_2119 [Xanthomonadales bacterium]
MTRPLSLAVTAALSLAIFAGGAQAGTFSTNTNPITVPSTSGGTVTVQYLFAGDGVTEDAQLDICYNPSIITGVTPTVLVPGSVCADQVSAAPCAAPNTRRLRIIPPSGGGTPLTSTPTAYCQFALTIAPGGPDVNAFVEEFIECAHPLGFMPCNRAGVPWEYQRVALQAPTIGFTPDGNPAGPGFPITLTPSSPGIATTTITATSAAPGGNPGDPGGPNGQIIDCTFLGPDAAHFSFNPAVIFPITYTAGTPRTEPFTVQCNRGPNPRSAQLECRVNDQGGPRSEWYDLTCPGALPADLNLPPSGPITLPGGFVGNTVTSTLPLTVVTPGETGAANATASCTATPPITVTPASITVPPGTSTPSPSGFTVGCTLTAAPQSGTVTCTINDREATPQTFTYDVTCPAGSLVPPPRPVPAGSAWGWYLLGLLTLLVGGFVAYRRLS